MPGCVRTDIPNATRPGGTDLSFDGLLSCRSCRGTQARKETYSTRWRCWRADGRSGRGRGGRNRNEIPVAQPGVRTEPGCWRNDDARDAQLRRVVRAPHAIPWDLPHVRRRRASHDGELEVGGMETPSFVKVVQRLLEALPQPRRIARLHFEQFFWRCERRVIPANLATFQVPCIAWWFWWCGLVGVHRWIPASCSSSGIKPSWSGWAGGQNRLDCSAETRRCENGGRHLDPGLHHLFARQFWRF